VEAEVEVRIDDPAGTAEAERRHDHLLPHPPDHPAGAVARLHDAVEVRRRFEHLECNAARTASRVGFEAEHHVVGRLHDVARLEHRARKLARDGCRGIAHAAILPRSGTEQVEAAVVDDGRPQSRREVLDNEALDLDLQRCSQRKRLRARALR
jgi:hypothetical protein